METTNTKNKIDLHGLFVLLQEQLKASLCTKKQAVSHGPSKGKDAELDWVNMLRKHLPCRYKVSIAFVVDSNGKMSDQIDIVIYDHHYSPVFYNEGETLYIPAESVYSVIEVKTVLDRDDLKYASEKSTSVRSLYRTSDKIPHAGGYYDSVIPKFIPAGVVATSCDWKPCFGLPFESTLKSFTLDEQINFGCIIEEGSFETDYENFSIRKSSKDTGRVFFFLTLLRILGQIATVPRIRVDDYLDKIVNKSNSTST